MAQGGRDAAAEGGGGGGGEAQGGERAEDVGGWTPPKMEESPPQQSGGTPPPTLWQAKMRDLQLGTKRWTGSLYPPKSSQNIILVFFFCQSRPFSAKRKL